MTRAVWSFWTKPFRSHYSSSWLSERHHLLAWVLSVETARKHYPETVLITDDEGAELLVNGIGLEFGHVSTELNVLSGHDPAWWVLGKLYTYRSQTKPFVHIDNDVFLWKALPAELISAPLFGQNPEYFIFGFKSYYRPEAYDQALKAADGWVPSEWNWYLSRRGGQAVNCGILGGHRVDFINYYADRAIAILEHPRNQSVWLQMDGRIRDNVLFEQYFLSACIAYHRTQQELPFYGMDVRFLFSSWTDAFKPEKARAVGYTHMIAGAKRNKIFAEHLEQRVARDYPAYYERCVKLSK